MNASAIRSMPPGRMARQFMRGWANFWRLERRNPAQAKLVAAEADGCVVGSAVVNQIAEHGKSPELVARVGAFVKSLAEAVKAV